MDLRTLDAPEHEEVVSCHDPDTGLVSIIAIHSTKLGPSLGGTRFYPFASEDEALADVLRLSKAMSYKSAAAGLDFGGGKAVIIGNPREDKTDDMIRSYARFVDSREGRYITTEDVGTTVADMDLIAQETPYVTGTHSGSGDPVREHRLGCVLRDAHDGEATLGRRHAAWAAHRDPGRRQGRARTSRVTSPRTAHA